MKQQLACKVDWNTVHRTCSAEYFRHAQGDYVVQHPRSPFAYLPAPVNYVLYPKTAPTRATAQSHDAGC